MNKEFQFDEIFNLIRIDEYFDLLNKNNHHIDNIYQICSKSGETLEGNCYYEHVTKNIIIDLIPKQMNHISLGLVSNAILEIGFNAGHSCLFYLISNPNSTVTIFDTCEHSYTIPCFEYLKNNFPNRLTLIKGDSNLTIPEYHKNNLSKKFDLVHIDGGHDRKTANNDFMNCYKIASNKIIFDDTDQYHLNELFELYLQNNLIKEVSMYKTTFYPHRIGKVIL
jgi:hypothetical protein